MSDLQPPSTPARVELRKVSPGDLPVFFEHQLDQQANHMAAFTAKDPADRAAFDRRWEKILADPGITVRTIQYQGQIAGSIVCHSWFGDPEIGYWLGVDFWGRGIASRALEAFLTLVPDRPLYARVARDNLASVRVLEKCGFLNSGVEVSFANARGMEIEELIYKLG